LHPGRDAIATAGIVGFVVLVGIWTYFAPLIFVTERIEIITFAVLLLASRLLHWASLKRYFTSADLL
jgi:hypothetical protein